MNARDFRASGSAGYWAGGFFCVLAIVSLSLGLIPLAQSLVISRKPISVQVPGQETIDFKLSGTYFGVAALNALSTGEKSLVQNMDYWLSDEKEKQFFQVNKFPSRNYYSEKEDSEAPLFELVIEKKGKYVLSADYPIGAEGPKLPVRLYRYDAPHVRSELIVGTLMFVLLGGLGGFLIWKSRRGRVSV